MTYSYSQLNLYQSCPRRYQYRYVDGWRERETSAALIFGRVFEQALVAMFQGKDPQACFFDEWGRWKASHLEWKGESWHSMYRAGLQLLEIFARDGRVAVADPEHNLQIEAWRTLPGGRRFAAVIDAVGSLDGVRRVIDWKTSATRMPSGSESLACLDPQLVAYSWTTGIRQVAFVLFVRKRTPEIQYITAEVSDRQIADWENFLSHTVAAIESRAFPPHMGVRFPHNQCPSCPYLGLCLGRQDLAQSRLVQIGVAQLDWCNELDF